MFFKKSSINKLTAIKTIVRYSVLTLVVLTINLYFGITTAFPSTIEANVNSPIDTSEKGLVGPLELPGWDGPKNIKSVSLKTKYKRLGGEYYTIYAERYLKTIDKVLREKGLDNNKLFIQMMFYIGEQESHWTEKGESRTPIVHCKGGYGNLYGSVVNCVGRDRVVHREYATGIFQFLPSTFRTVSNGDIFDAEDQIRAFIRMMELGRIDEYETFFKCNFSPCLNNKLKVYALLYPRLHKTSFNTLISN